LEITRENLAAIYVTTRRRTVPGGSRSLQAIFFPLGFGEPRLAPLGVGANVIRAGGIEAAVEQGLVDSGVTYESVETDVPVAIAGSIRDDGPLPDTVTEAVEAQDASRERAHEADLVLMLSTLLHSVAVGNCLPSTTRTVCVDINPATVTQLLDRGSQQAVGMVTDIGTFVPILADHLLDD